MIILYFIFVWIYCFCTMLLPREQIYRDRTFDQLMEDEFTREIFETIERAEDDLMLWRNYSLPIDAEEQYAELFNMTYYFIIEATMRPRPQLRVGEYELYIEKQAEAYSLVPESCKEIIFSIMYYVADEKCLNLGTPLLDRLRLRADEYSYNSFFRVMSMEKVSAWLDFMMCCIDAANEKKKSTICAAANCDRLVSPFIVSPKKQTSILVVLETMYKAKWIRKADGSKYRSRDEMINDVMRVLFNQEEAKDIKQKLSYAKNRTLDGRKKYFDDLMKYIAEDEQVVKE